MTEQIRCGNAGKNDSPMRRWPGCETVASTTTPAGRPCRDGQRRRNFGSYARPWPAADPSTAVCVLPLVRRRSMPKTALLRPSRSRSLNATAKHQILRATVGDVGTAAPGCRLGVALQAWTLYERTGNDLDEAAKRPDIAVGGGG